MKYLTRYVKAESPARDSGVQSYTGSYLRDSAWTIGLIILTLLVSFSTANAQPLEQLLEQAAENNIELKALHQEYLAALEKGPQVSQMPDPEFNAGIFVLQPETRVGPQWVKVGASQMFPWKGTLKAREDVVLAMAKAKYERIAATQLNLFFQIKAAYYQIYELEQSQDIVRRNIEVFHALERFTLAKVESGKGSTADVLRVQLKIQELNKDLEILQNQKSKPQSTINQVLNRPLETEITIIDSLTLAIIPFNKDSLAANIRSNHPMIKQFEDQQEASRKAIELNKFEGKPTFGVGLDYIMVTKRNDVEISKNGRDILMPKASVKIPFNRKKYKAKEREEELIIAALENRKEDLQIKFLSVIEKAYADHEDATLKLQLYTDLIRTTQAVINVLEADYSASGRNFDELIRLQAEMINYDLKTLKAIVKSNIAKAGIERFIL